MTSTKFEINRNVLLQALQQSAYAVMTYKEYNSRSGWADAFRSYVFKVEADQMAILTSNGEIFMSVTISVGNPDGATATFALFAPQLLKAVKTLEDQQLTFEVYEYQVVVRHSIGSFALPLSEGAAEFMERPKPTINETWAKEYSCTNPTALYAGKCWKRHVERPRQGIDKWYLCFCTDVPNEPQYIDINTREILIMD